MEGMTMAGSFPAGPGRTARVFRAIAVAATMVATTMVVATVPARADDFTWTTVAQEVAARLGDAAGHYAAGDAKAAKRAVSEAYFGVFESRKLEAAMRKTLGQDHTYRVERQFGALRKLIGATAPVEEFRATVDDLGRQLAADAVTLDAAGVSEEVYDVR